MDTFAMRPGWHGPRRAAQFLATKSSGVALGYGPRQHPEQRLHVRPRIDRRHRSHSGRALAGAVGVVLGGEADERRAVLRRIGREIAASFELAAETVGVARLRARERRG